MAATFDISAAYRITPISPEDQHLLCVSWEGKIYLDYAASFGMSSSAGIFGWVADMLVALYAAAGFKVMIKWVDDFFVIRLPGETWSEEDFIEFTARLGVPWSWDKLRRFAIIQRYIGFMWDLSRLIVAFPEEKLDEIKALV